MVNTVDDPAPHAPRTTSEGGSSRRIVVAGMSTLTVLVLLFGYHTSTEGATATATVAASAAVAGTSGGSATGTTAGSGVTSGSGASATFTGTAADTRYGPVQVEITVAGGTVTAVDVVEYPTGNGKDQEINARAVPTLVQETLAAQSADVDMVSGATYTSHGYLTSLQSALDQAGL